MTRIAHHLPLVAAWRTALGLRPCLSLILSLFAVDALAYTEINVRTENHQKINGGNWSIIVSDWRRYDDSDSEVNEMYNKSSIFYNNLPKTYEPLVGTTNVTVTRDNVTWNPISTQKTIYETYKTGLILVESGKVNNNWYKVFSITNGQYSYDSLQYYGNTPSVFTFYNLDVWIVTIVKSSGMPNDPYWLASVDDGPDSKVSVDTQYPVTCAWLRKYFPNQPYSELKACAESIAPNGMPYYVAEMMKYDPADPTDTFRIALDFEDGKPRPRVDIRSYRFQNFGFLIYVHCKKNLSDLDWTPCTEYSEAEQYNFFKAVLVNTHE